MPESTSGRSEKYARANKIHEEKLITDALSTDKLQWLNKERLYWSHRFGVPMSVPIPEGFPAATSDLQAALANVAANSPENLIAITERLFSIFWADGNTKISSPDGFQPFFPSEMFENQGQAIVSQNLPSSQQMYQ